jgi:hypothetical protein
MTTLIDTVNAKKLAATWTKVLQDQAESAALKILNNGIVSDEDATLLVAQILQKSSKKAVGTKSPFAWVAKGCTDPKERRGAMAYVLRTEDGDLVSTNGRTIMIAKDDQADRAPGLYDRKTGLFVCADGDPNIPNQGNGNFPNYKQCIPNGYPLATIESREINADDGIKLNLAGGNFCYLAADYLALAEGGTGTGYAFFYQDECAPVLFQSLDMTRKMVVMTRRPPK